MLKKTIMVIGMAALTLTSTLVAAEARGKHSGGFHRGGHGKHWHGHGHRFGHRGFGFHHYGYYPSYGGGCYRFKNRYFATGSRFWLRKYDACRYGY